MSRHATGFLLIAATTLLPLNGQAGTEFYNLEFDLPENWKSKPKELSVVIAGNSSVASEKAFALMLAKPIDITTNTQWFDVAVNELVSLGLIKSGNSQSYRTSAGYTVHRQDFSRAPDTDSYSRVMAFSNHKEATLIFVATPEAQVPPGTDKSITAFLNTLRFIPTCADDYVETRLNGRWSYFTGGAEFGRTISWAFRKNGRFHTNSQTSVMASGTTSPYTPSAVSVTGYSSSAQDGCYSIHDNKLNLTFDNGVTKTLPIEISGREGEDPQKFVTIGKQLLFR